MLRIMIIGVISDTHDHLPRIAMQDGILHINPGECCGWRYGRRTVALLNLAAMQADFIDVPL